MHPARIRTGRQQAEPRLTPIRACASSPTSRELPVNSGGRSETPTTALLNSLRVAEPPRSHSLRISDC